VQEQQLEPEEAQIGGSFQKSHIWQLIPSGKLT
jgi:hypothetical protein